MRDCMSEMTLRSNQIMSVTEIRQMPNPRRTLMATMPSTTQFMPFW